MPTDTDYLSRSWIVNDEWWGGINDPIPPGAYTIGADTALANGLYNQYAQYIRTTQVAPISWALEFPATTNESYRAERTPEVECCICGTTATEAHREFPNLPWWWEITGRYRNNEHRYCSDCFERINSTILTREQMSINTETDSWNLYRCDGCGHIVEGEGEIYAIRRHGNMLVESCLCPECESTVTDCEVCGYDGLRWETMEEVRDYGFVCNSGRCMNEVYWCDDCCTYVLSEDFNHDEDTCHRCINSRNRPDTRRNQYDTPTAIHGYHHHVNTEYFGYGNKYIGIELEVERSSSSVYCEDMAEKVYDTMCRDNRHVYFERDGSLSDGIEIISMPMTVPYFWRLASDFKKMLNLLSKNGYRSHNGGRCGLHLHISRVFFGTGDERDSAIGRLVALNEIFWDDIHKLSRRKNVEWGKPYKFVKDGEYTKDKSHILGEGKKVAKTQYLDRYQAINLTRDNTVEFRMFRGTLQPDSFFSSIDICVAMAKAAVAMGDADITNNDKTLYEVIKPYLQKRRMVKKYMRSRGVEV